MRITAPTKPEWAIIILLMAVALALVLSPIQSVWDGHFPLTIHMVEQQQIEPDAKEAIAHPGVYEYGFRAIKKSPEGQMIIDVPTSGRSGSFGTSGTYNHPKFLIVEYRLTQDDNGTLARKMFPLPVGRGARSITISLP
jgi:hypothetical protein